MSDDDSSDEWRSGNDRLDCIRRSDEGGRKTATIQVFLSDLRGRDDQQQLNAIFELNSLLLSVPDITFDDFPPNFCEVVVDMLFDETVALNVRQLLLSFLDSFCERGPRYVEGLEERVLYSRLFRFCTSPQCMFQLDKWLAIIAHFLRVSPVAFDYFQSVKLVEYLNWAIENHTKQLDKELLTRVMAQYALSPFFDPSKEKAAVSIMMGHARSILDADLLQKSTSFIGSAIEISASIMSKTPDVDQNEEYYRDGRSTIILELINVENLQITRDCAFYLAIVTANSNIVCRQLVESRIFQKLIDALLNPVIFDECASHCFTAMYNCLVAQPDKSADIFQSRDTALQEVLQKVFKSGKLHTKQVVMDFLAIIMYNVNPSNALELAAEYDFFRQVPIILESGDLDMITNAVAAASKIIQALDSNPQFSKNNKVQEMATVEALESIESSFQIMRPEVQELAEIYQNWIAKNLKASGSDVNF